jgi:hypothetical protein
MLSSTVVESVYLPHFAGGRVDQGMESIHPRQYPITTSNVTQYHFVWPVRHSFGLRFWIRIQKLLGLCAFPRSHGMV